jgi:hypothetical protein
MEHDRKVLHFSVTEHPIRSFESSTARHNVRHDRPGGGDSVALQKNSPRKQIASQLSISINTVKTYLRQIALKINGLGIRPSYPSALKLS